MSKGRRQQAYLRNIVPRLSDIRPPSGFRINIHHPAQTMLDSIKQSKPSTSSTPLVLVLGRLIRRPIPLPFPLGFPLLDPLLIR